MQKVNLKDLSRWLLVMPGTGIEFERPDARTVRIELNAEQAAAISLVRDDGEIQFLATVSGLCLLEFSTAGRFEIITDTPVWMYSAEFEDIAFTVPDPVIFTKIAERRKRNPELEYIADMMQRNMEKRFAQLDNERARVASHVAGLEAELARTAATRPDPEVSGSSDGGGQSDPDVGTAASAASV